MSRGKSHAAYGHNQHGKREYCFARPSRRTTGPWRAPNATSPANLGATEPERYDNKGTWPYLSPMAEPSAVQMAAGWQNISTEA